MKRTCYTPVMLTPKERAELERAAQLREGTISDALRAAIHAQYIDPPDPHKKNEGRAVRLDNSGATPLGILP